jgi:hypothetical protein
MTCAVRPRGENGSASISPGASVLSATIVPSASNRNVFVAPISAALWLARSANPSAACLCGTVTFTPRNPAAGRALTVSASSSGGTGRCW